MNALVGGVLKPASVYTPRVVVQLNAQFATSKEKADNTKAKAKKASKEEAHQNEKQVKALLLQYFKMRNYVPPKVSPEKQKEYAEIAKEYTRQMTYLHHTAETRLNDKIFLRDLAISALPTEELRKQAVMTDTEQIPGKYFYPAKKARFEDLSKELAW